MFSLETFTKEIKEVIEVNPYLDFVDLNYKPRNSDLICLFRIEPAKGISLKEAAGMVASESSNGTWTELTTLKEHIRKMRGRVFSIRSDYVKIAYPIDLFELGNMPQIISSIAGNIFGMKGNTKEHCNTAYDIWYGGLDLLKDDENLSNQKFNRFEKRLNGCMKIRDRVEKETGERKSYLINITSETKEMIKRAKLVKDYGNEFVMVDILTAGFSGFQTIRNECQDLKLAIHAHRAFHSTFTRNPRHGVSMLVVADVARLIGADNLHIGTVFGKLVSPEEEVINLEDEIQKKFVKDGKNRLSENWYDKKRMFAVSSGGLYPSLIPKIIKILGKDIILQVGGGVHGHRYGTRAGARAVRQIVDATMKGINLKEYSKDNNELRVALRQWG
nr:RuBisCO long chain, Form III-b [uncultured archaeon]